MQILESTQRSWRANNALLNRVDTAGLPYLSARGWVPVDLGRDTGERFGYGPASVRHQQLREMADAELAGYVQELVAGGGRSGAGAGTGGHDAPPVLSLQQRRRSAEEEKDRRAAIRLARVRRVLRESRKQNGTGVGVDKHPTAPTEFIKRAQALLLERGLVMDERPVDMTSDSLFAILASVIHAGERGPQSIKSVRSAIALHMESCMRCQRLAVMDEEEMFGQRPADDADRAAFIKRHIR
jgi:hypothetical protein